MYLALVMKMTEELHEMEKCFTIELTPSVFSRFKSSICKIAQGVHVHAHVYMILCSLKFER